MKLTSLFSAAALAITSFSANAWYGPYQVQQETLMQQYQQMLRVQQEWAKRIAAQQAAYLQQLQQGYIPFGFPPVDFPAVPDFGQMPDFPAPPKMPDFGQIPDFPTPPKMPDFGQIPDFPTPPKMPDFGQMPDFPAPPKMPDFGQIPDFPTLPKMPDFGQIPDFPTPPKMPDFGQIPDFPAMPAPLSYGSGYSEFDRMEDLGKLFRMRYEQRRAEARKRILAHRARMMELLRQHYGPNFPAPFFHPRMPEKTVAPAAQEAEQEKAVEAAKATQPESTPEKGGEPEKPETAPEQAPATD